MALASVRPSVVDKNHNFLHYRLPRYHYHSLSIPASSISKPRIRPVLANTTTSSQDSSGSSQPLKPTIISEDLPPVEPNSTSRSEKPISPGQGFGSRDRARSAPGPSSSKKKLKSGRERASVIRRSPVEKPVFMSMKEEVEAKERAQYESAFLLVWLGLGALILIEGIVLAASGFLPEQWDRFFVKYLYPSFTPTVGVFVAGTVVYGVLKYLQNEDAKMRK